MTHTHNAMVRRITRAYRQASTADRAAGLGWYAEARRVALEIAAGHSVSLETAVGVVAAKSPQCRWSTNVVFAERIIAAAVQGLPCPQSGLTATTATAWAIATGTAPLDALGTVHPRSGRVISGHKVRAFYANILGDTNAVTVDMWAWAVATNGWRIVRGQRIPQEANMRAREYERIADAYRRAAAILGVTPRECQAAAWVAARGVKPTDVEFHARAAA